MGTPEYLHPILVTNIQNATYCNYASHFKSGSKLLLLFLHALGLTLHPCAEMIRRSAGILSPPLTSTRSPATTSSALIQFFSPSRTTRACYKTRIY